MYKALSIYSIILFGLISAAQAQQFNPQQQSPAGDRLQRILLQPGQIMRQASRINLTDDQKAAIKDVIRQTEAKSLDLKWDIRDESEKMFELIREDVVEENKVLKQADKVMDMEKEMKMMQLGMLLKIKNILTPEQVQQLQKQRNHRNRQPQRNREFPPEQ